MLIVLWWKWVLFLFDLLRLMYCQQECKGNRYPRTLSSSYTYTENHTVLVLNLFELTRKFPLPWIILSLIIPQAQCHKDFTFGLRNQNNWLQYAKAADVRGDVLSPNLRSWPQIFTSDLTADPEICCHLLHTLRDRDVSSASLLTCLCWVWNSAAAAQLLPAFHDYSCISSVLWSLVSHMEAVTIPLPGSSAVHSNNSKNTSSQPFVHPLSRALGNSDSPSDPIPSSLIEMFSAHPLW